MPLLLADAVAALVVALLLALLLAAVVLPVEDGPGADAEVFALDEAAVFVEAADVVGCVDVVGVTDVPPGCALGDDPPPQPASARTKSVAEAIARRFTSK